MLICIALLHSHDFRSFRSREGLHNEIRARKKSRKIRKQAGTSREIPEREFCSARNREPRIFTVPRSIPDVTHSTIHFETVYITLTVGWLIETLTDKRSLSAGNESAKNLAKNLPHCSGNWRVTTKKFSNFSIYWNSHFSPRDWIFINNFFQRFLWNFYLFHKYLRSWLTTYFSMECRVCSNELCGNRQDNEQLLDDLGSKEIHWI